jgi:hypothetical protein
MVGFTKLSYSDNVDLFGVSSSSLKKADKETNSTTSANITTSSTSTSTTTSQSQSQQTSVVSTKPIEEEKNSKVVKVSEEDFGTDKRGITSGAVTTSTSSVSSIPSTSKPIPISSTKSSSDKDNVKHAEVSGNVLEKVNKFKSSKGNSGSIAQSLKSVAKKGEQLRLEAEIEVLKSDNIRLDTEMSQLAAIDDALQDLIDGKVSLDQIVSNEVENINIDKRMLLRMGELATYAETRVDQLFWKSVIEDVLGRPEMQKLRIEVVEFAEKDK